MQNVFNYIQKLSTFDLKWINGMEHCFVLNAESFINLSENYSIVIYFFDLFLNVKEVRVWLSNSVVYVSPYQWFYRSNFLSFSRGLKFCCGIFIQNGFSIPFLGFYTCMNDEQKLLKYIKRGRSSVDRLWSMEELSRNLKNKSKRMLQKCTK